MLYYSQGKGDTNEKVKTLRHEDFKNKKQKMKSESLNRQS